MTSADKALKTLYLGAVAEQLNTTVNPLLTKIKQTTNNVWGKEIRKLAQYGINGGIGAGTETGELPLAASNNYEQFVLTLKNLYGTIEISDKAILASSSSVGAFVNLLNAEMEGLIKASSYNFGRMLYGDGSGKLATIVSVNSNGTITLDDVKCVVEGIVIDVMSSSGEVISGCSARRVLSVDRATKTIKVSGNTILGESVGSNAFIVVQGSYGQELTGLKAIFNNTGSIYGLSREENPWLVPYMDSTTTSISETAIQKAIDTLDENAGSEIDFIVCSSGVKRAYQNHLATYKRNIDVMDLNGGFKAISYNGIPLVSDRFCPNKTMYLLNTKDFALHQLCDWKWLEGEDGKVLKQIAGKPCYTATLVKYADIICDKPCGQAVFTNIEEA